MSTKLWYDRYQPGWLHALPLGNGRLAAMFYGDPQTEHIQMNEESLYTGRPVEETYNGSPEMLDRIRRLLFEGDYETAGAISDQYFLTEPPRVRFYQTAGDLYLEFGDDSAIEHYRKELELTTGIARANYQRGETTVESACFVSEKYDVLVYRVAARGAEKLNFALRYARQDTHRESRPAEFNAILGQRLVVESDVGEIRIQGQAIDGAHPYYGVGGESVRFGGLIRLETDGTVLAQDGYLTVTNASEAQVVVSFETDYDVHTFTFDREKDLMAVLRRRLDTACAVPYSEILQQHIRDHGGAFATVELNLGENRYADLPTDRRLQRIREGATDDLDFYTLYFQYGRYLLLASSGGNAVLPANLQGKWADDFMPPWGADYHTNINLQMNYWIANVGHLHQTMKPLIHFVKMNAAFGEKTARQLYHTDGWVIHHTTDIYGRTGVHDSSQCGFFPMAGPWLCINLWEQYAFTGDRDYLENTLYPILSGACRFLLGYLVEDKQGRLVTNPSNSPENEYYYVDRHGEKKKTMFTYGATIDFEIIDAVFRRMIYAAQLLKRDEELVQTLKTALTRLPKLEIGQRYGTIREWIEDFEEVEPQHRHISHLFGLYPSDQIRESEPELFEAAKRTIARRLAHGGGATGWSRAWIINFYARLGDGENAAEHLRQLMVRSTIDNLFDMHPPFQIDGNFGGSAGIAEMLLQSHLGQCGQRMIAVLPALPKTWTDGSFRGLCARGNFSLDAQWRGGRVSSVTVHAPTGGICRLKLTRAMENYVTSAQTERVGETLLLYTESGGTYEIAFL